MCIYREDCQFVSAFVLTFVFALALVFALSFLFVFVFACVFTERIVSLYLDLYLLAFSFVSAFVFAFVVTESKNAEGPACILPYRPVHRREGAPEPIATCPGGGRFQGAVQKCRGSECVIRPDVGQNAEEGSAKVPRQGAIRRIMPNLV